MNTKILFKNITGICLLSLLMAMTNLSYSQSDEDAEDRQENKKRGLSYRVLTDAPEELGNLNIALLPGIADIWVSNVNLGFGVSADYLHDMKHLAGLKYRRAAYFDLSKKYNNSKRGQVLQELELSGTYFLSNKLDPESKQLTLSSSRDYATVTSLPYKIVHLRGIRFGYFGNSSMVTSRDHLFHFKGYWESDPSKTVREDLWRKGEGAMMYVNAISLGYFKRRLVNLETEFEKYGRVNARQFVDFYYDAMLGLVTLDPMLIGIENPETIIINEHNRKANFGFRLGFVITNDSKSGAYFGMETGRKPGIIAGGNNLFLQIKLGYNLGFRI